MKLRGDVYYSIDYASLYLHKDDSIFEFEFKDGDSYLYNIAIKRPITKIGNRKIIDGCYDLETAYGYGGFLTNSSDNDFLQLAMKKYRARCNDENIIAEFIRFHPFNSFPIDYGNFLNFKLHDREVVATSSVCYEQVYLSYHKNLKRDIKATKKHSLKIKHVKENKIAYKNTIKNLYTKTMEKNNASTFYYFNEDYFEKLLNMKECMLFLVFHDEKIITAVIMLSGISYLYYHISATDPSYYKMNSNRFALDEIIKFACSINKKVYLGGGLTGHSEDSLYSFKKKFSSQTLPFYIAGCIYNDELYNKYIETFNSQTDENIRYFLKYRLDIGDKK